MAKIPIILEAGRADGILIKTDNIYDDNKKKFLSDKLEEIDNNNNTLNNTVKSLTNTINNNKSDIETQLEAERIRATNAENNLRETINTAQETANSASETANSAHTAAQEAKATAAALLQDIPWEGRHMNMFTETGEYHIHGESTDANDGLPILNSGTIDARLTVLDSSLTNGTGEKTDVVVTQILRLSNRMGGDGHVYVRTAQAATKSQLSTPSSTAWGTWEKLMGIFEKNAVTNIADLDTYTTNGMYSGLFANTTFQSLGDINFSPGDTFLLITVNGYAASAFGTPQLTQMLYKLPSKKGSGNSSACMYLRTAWWNVNVEPKKWEFSDWDYLITNSDFSEQLGIVLEAVTAASTSAQEAKSAAETAQSTATAAQTKNTEQDARLDKIEARIAALEAK